MNAELQHRLATLLFELDKLHFVGMLGTAKKPYEQIKDLLNLQGQRQINEISRSIDVLHGSSNTPSDQYVEASSIGGTRFV